MSKALLKAGAKRLAMLYYARQHREKLEVRMQRYFIYYFIIIYLFILFIH